MEIAGYYRNLAKGFKSIGVDCDLLLYEKHPFYPETTIPPKLLGEIQKRNSDKKVQKNIKKLLLIGYTDILKIIWAFYVIYKYNTFIFSAGNSLLRWNIDLPILKLLNRKVIAVFHGSDTRPPFCDGGSFTKHLTWRELKKNTYKKSKIINYFQSQGSFIIANPLSSFHYLKKPFINFLAIGLPLDLDKNKENVCEKNVSHSSVCILHAPSNPRWKGTEIIRKAVNNLKLKGFSICYVEILNKKNFEVIEALKKCDFVVDQVFSDFPLAGLATEAAWYGKPSIVGGYGLKYLKSILPDDMWPPSKSCHPSQIEQAIEEIINEKDERNQLGAAAKKFVRTKWKASEVASKYMKIIHGNTCKEWWLYPNNIVYLEGGGLSEEKTKQKIRDIVLQAGPKSLCLGDRPDLERAFLQFAGLLTKLEQNK